MLFGEKLLFPFNMSQMLSGAFLLLVGRFTNTAKSTYFSVSAKGSQRYQILVLCCWSCAWSCHVYDGNSRRQGLLITVFK